MVPTISGDTIFSVIKVVALVFGLIHLGIGFVMIRQILLMNSKIQTKNSGCLRAAGLIHVLVLAGTVLLIIFI